MGSRSRSRSGTPRPSARPSKAPAERPQLTDSSRGRPTSAPVRERSAVRGEPFFFRETARASPGGEVVPIVQLFLDRHSEDQFSSEVREVLLSQPTEIQVAVVEQGSLASARDPIAVLKSRIRKCSEQPSQNGGRGRVPPAPAAPALYNPERSLSPVSSFLSMNPVDLPTERYLREQSYEVQDRVMAEGSLSGTRNPEAVLRSRIQKYSVPTQRPRVQGAPPSKRDLSAYDQASMPEELVAEFVMDNGLDEVDRDNLLNQPEDVLRAVVAEGRLTGKNLSGVLESRIRRQTERLRSGGSAPPRVSGMPSAGGGASRNRVLDDAMEFAERNNLDVSARTSFLSQSQEVMLQVMAAGELNGKNPSALLCSRLKRLQQGLPPSAGLGPPGGRAGSRPRSPPRARSRSPRPREPRRASHSPVSRFLAEADLDEKAIRAMREQPRDIQEAVIAEGQVAGARNPSAVLLSRIKKLRTGGGGGGRGGGGGGGGGGGRGPSPIRPVPTGRPVMDVDQFAAINGLDDIAVEELKKAAPHVQARVMEEGTVTGRNPSAIVLSRLKRAR